MTDTNVRWKYHKSVPQLPSPLIYSNVLYMVNDGGIVTTLHPETGAELGQGRLKGAIDHYYASPVAAKVRTPWTMASWPLPSSRSRTSGSRSGRTGSRRRPTTRAVFPSSG